MSHVPYASVVGIIMYDMVCTRFDVSHIVDVIRKYMKTQEKSIGRQQNGLCYLKGTLMSIWFQENTRTPLTLTLGMQIQIMLEI